MQCENCNKMHNGTYGSGRFCGATCARGFATKNKRDQINKQVSVTMSGRKLSAEHKKNIELSTNFNRKEKEIRYCLECGEKMSCRPSDKRKFCKPICWVKYTEKHKDAFLLYRQRCNFDFDVSDYPNKFDMRLIEQHGWYSPCNKGNNLAGISKDHMLSVKDGFVLGIDPEIIKHPANCQLMKHTENQKKRTSSSITIEELIERIRCW